MCSKKPWLTAFIVQALLEQLERRHEDKHEWFLKVKKRKLLEKQQEEEEAARAAKN